MNFLKLQIKFKCLCYRKLEEEKKALESERQRVYDSGLPSSADSVSPRPDDEGVTPPPPRRRRRRWESDSPESYREPARGRYPEVGKARPPDFENVRSKVGSRDNAHYKPRGGR